MMRSNGILPMTDSHRISPQTTASSGYHSDLSSATSANESPQCIHDVLSSTLEKSSLSSSASQLQKRTSLLTANSTFDKSTTGKSLSRISSFIRKQYERAKSKLISKPLSSSQIHGSTMITTCSKATSTTPTVHLSENNSIQTKKHSEMKHQQNAFCNQRSYGHPSNLSSIYQQSSYTEPVYSLDMNSLHNHQIKRPTSYQHKNYASIHDCYSYQPPYRYSTLNSSNQYSSSHRRLATMANFENNNNYNMHRHQYYPVEALSSSVSSTCQNYYPYRYINNNYDSNRSNYVPLSDFISTNNSAFKPIRQQKQKHFYRRPSYNIYEQVPQSDDPCDLEVAQYFPQTSQWSNPNYFDIYSNEINVSKKNYTETLC